MKKKAIIISVIMVIILALLAIFIFKPWLEASNEYNTITSKIKKENKRFKNRKWNIKKSYGHIHAEKEDKFKFIEENKEIYDIKRLCKALKISRSEYYYHKNHRTNVYKEDNRKLDVDILRNYNESKKY